MPTNPEKQNKAEENHTHVYTHADTHVYAPVYAHVYTQNVFAPVWQRHDFREVKQVRRLVAAADLLIHPAAHTRLTHACMCTLHNIT